MRDGRLFWVALDRFTTPLRAVLHWRHAWEPGRCFGCHRPTAAVPEHPGRFWLYCPACQARVRRRHRS